MSRGRFVLLLLLVVALAGAARLPRLGEPIGGFHGFNEANYLLEASNFRHGSLLFPTVDGSTLFIESPPLYAYLLMAAPSLFGARVITVIISLLLVALTALLARKRFGNSAGWITAVLMSVAPVAAISGRNIQTDSLYLTFVIAAMLVWPREDAWTMHDAVLVGALLGLALFSKLFAAVAIIALVILGKRSSLRDRAIALGIAGVIPLLFYGYHFIHDRSFFIQHVFGGAAAATTFPRSAEEIRWLLTEAWWAYSPGVALALIGGLVAALIRRSRDDWFFLSPLLCYAVFYLHTHKHSYYLLSLLPFGAILAARAIASWPWRTLRVVVLAAIAFHSTLIALVDLATMKLGYRDIADFGSWADRLPTDAPIILDQVVADNAFPIVKYYQPRRRILVNDSLPARPDGYLEIPPKSILLRFATEGAQTFARDRYALALGTWLVTDDHPNPHYFQPSHFQFVRARHFELGFTRLDTDPALEALPLDGHRVFRAGGGGVTVD